MIVVPKYIIFLDKNICIKIINASKYKDELQKLHKYDIQESFIFGLLSFLEDGFRNNNEYCFQDRIDLALQDDSNKLKKFFKFAHTDIDHITRQDILNLRRENNIGNMDFNFNEQIEYYKYIVGLLHKQPKQVKINDLQSDLIIRAKQLSLKFYYPLVMASIASLYNSKIRALLKINEPMPENVVTDLTHVLRFSSMGINLALRFNSLNYTQVNFETDDKNLNYFLDNIDIKILNDLLWLRGNYTCPIKKGYFNKINDPEWKFLKKLFSTP